MARSKKEIDKELMYKKLMPTAGSNTPTEAPPEPAAEQSPEPPPALPQMDIAPEPTPKNAPQEPDISVAAAALVNGTDITPKKDDGELVNVMEILVNARIDAAMEKFRCCTCDKCKQDITAITLNKLVPCYIISTDTDKHEKAEAQYAGQVGTSLVQAILTVKAHPSHE